MKLEAYLIQMNLYLVLFYTFYWFILKNETFFNLNRIYILSSVLFSVIIPLVKASWINGLFITEHIQHTWINVNFLAKKSYTTPVKLGWMLGDYVTLIYGFGVIVFSFRLIYKFILLNQLLRNKQEEKAFSFFSIVSISENLPFIKSVEKHELTHVKQFHSIDIILFELLAVLNWFNPIIYAYKKSIKEIHEFIADDFVLQAHIDKKQYAMLLLSHRFGVNPQTLTSNFFNPSVLKRRIEMINKNRSKKIATLKYGLSIPCFLLALVLSSAKIKESEILDKISTRVHSEKKIGEILERPFESNSKTSTNVKVANGLKFYKNKSVASDTKIIGIDGKVLIGSKLFRNTAETTLNTILTNSPTSKKVLKDYVKSVRTPRVVRLKQTNLKSNINQTYTENVSGTKGQMPLLLIGSIMYEIEQISSNTITAKEKIGGKVIVIKTDRVASIDVLKGELAVQKFGEDGKNGVIEFTLEP